MSFVPAAADVHVVLGSPWKQAVISLIELRSPYQPWSMDGLHSISPRIGLLRC